MKNKNYQKLFNLLIALSIGLKALSQDVAATSFPRMHAGRAEDTSVKSMKQVLTALEGKYGIRFTYKDAVLENKTVRNFSPESQEISKVLDELLTPNGLKFKKIDDIYVVYAVDGRVKFKQIRRISREADQKQALVSSKIETLALPKAELLRSYMNAKDVIVSGKVTGGETNEGLPGVSVSVKGTTKGTTTNAEGQYTLSEVSENATLVFSSIGYVTEEVAVGGRSSVNIQLLPDLQALGEVVVVGYGTQKKSSVTGAISSVSAKEISALPVPSVEQAIQGRVAGTTVTNNGSPGEAPLVRIRGVNSINYASNPLYVVDGIVAVGDFNNFDSKDIESVEVLKDANSAAIFGSRAAAGVILITTKKGTRDGKTHVNLDSYVGVQNAWRTLDLLKRDQYIQYGTALRQNAGQAIAPQFGKINDPIYPGATQTFAQTETDWQDELFQSAIITQTNLSVSGGNEKSRFHSSAGYFKQDGIMLGTGYERYNFRINSDHKITQNITFGQTLLVSYGSQKREQNAGGRTQIQNMIRMVPYLPVLNPENIGGYGGATGADASDPQNPVRSALQDLSLSNNLRVLGSLFLEANITPWLKYRFNLGINYSTSRDYTYQPIYFEGFNGRDRTSLGETRSNFFSPLYTNQVTFDRTFGKHYVNLTGIIEYQTSKSSSLGASGKVGNNLLKELNGLEEQNFNGSRNESVIYSYISRLNYEYGNKYLLSASIRSDGASNFAPGKKFGNFPSIGLGWRISEENFMKNVPAISELKLRGSYGTMGYIPGNYLWQSTISANTSAVLGGQRVLGAFYDRLGNQELAWEITKMTNVGIDAGFFRNRLTLSAEYYVRNTDNLILDVFPAVSTGFSQPTSANVGRMRNWGYEFQAAYNQSANAFKWNLSANISIAKNKVLGLETEKAFLERGANGDYGGFDITRTEAGNPVQSFYGWQVDGIFQTNDQAKAAPRQNLPDNVAKYDPTKNTAAGDIRFKDANGDGSITAADRVYLGSFLPDFTYGLSASASYMNFDLSLFFQGVQGNKVFNGTKVIEQGMLRLFNSSVDVLNAWTPTNTNTNVPRAIDTDPNGNSRTSNRFIEDGSYLRLKNLSLGYTVPSTVLKSFTRGALGNVRVYVASQNLLTFTRYTGYDPEVGSRFGTQLTQGIDYGQFPAARSFMIGLQAGF